MPAAEPLPQPILYTLSAVRAADSFIHIISYSPMAAAGTRVVPRAFAKE